MNDVHENKTIKVFGLVLDVCETNDKVFKIYKASLCDGWWLYVRDEKDWWPKKEQVERYRWNMILSNGRYLDLRGSAGSIDEAEKNSRLDLKMR